jgi:hypothetical protein
MSTNFALTLDEVPGTYLGHRGEGIFAATNDVSSDLSANFINEKILISFRFRREDGCF